MFVYTGRLEWSRYGVDELFVVVLPNGPVRVNDTVYLSSQWTVDSKGFTKQKWFSAQTVQKVSKTDDGEDSFYLHQGWYAYDVQSQQGYQSISITMSNPGGGKSTMTLNRVYQPKGDAPVEAARIWTGRFDWPEHASDEPFVAIVPQSFGVNKPVLVFWQWTTDADGNQKVPCALQGVQEAEEPADNKLKFTFTNQYTLDFTWDEATEELAIHMKAPDKHEKDIGPFKLAALIEYHSEYARTNTTFDVFFADFSSDQRLHTARSTLGNQVLRRPVSPGRAVPSTDSSSYAFSSHSRRHS